MTIETLKKDMQKEFPKLVITSEKPFWLTILFSLLSKITKQNYNDFTQTIGQNIYLAKNWDSYRKSQQMEILMHERVHLRQFKKLGMFLMALIYLFLPVPTVFAMGRVYLEKQAIEESLKNLLKRKPGEEERENLRSWYISVFCSSDYFWMFPFPSIVSRWFDKLISELPD